MTNATYPIILSCYTALLLVLNDNAEITISIWYPDAEAGVRVNARFADTVIHAIPPNARPMLSIPLIPLEAV